MDHYQQDLITGQLVDVGFLSQQMPIDGVAYQMHDAALMVSPPTKVETFEPGYVGSFEDTQQHDGSRSYSCSSITSQSLSPQIHNPHPELRALQVTNLPFNSGSEETSPTTTNPSRKDSDDESYRAERRRAQNRAAQRAYRQRKDQSLKQREREIENLREELDKAQRLNKTLCKVVSVLRQRLKEAPDATSTDAL